MLTFLLVLVLVLGVNTTVWGLAGLTRLVLGRLRRGRPLPPGDRVEATEVAVLIAAHNEELVIAKTIESALSLLVPNENIFVVSDGSHDDTALIAWSYGVKILELSPNRGKAGALAAGIEHFQLADRFRIVVLLDADTRLAADYLTTGLPFFDDPEVVAVAGRAATIAEPQPTTRLGRFLVAYRERFYVVVQYLLKYGQAARPANVVSIVPGFASMYRSSVLPEIDISAPGLAIEDFNMTFEIHAKRLGRIAFHPRAAVAYTQDPDTYREYTRQLHRWTLGFWQTVRRHGLHLGRFWGALVLFVIELVSSSVMLLLTVPLLLLAAVAALWGELTGDHGGVVALVSDLVPAPAIVLGVLVPDYLLTVFAAIITRRPKYLLLGLAFPVMRVVDAAICLRTLPEAYFARSAGSSRGAWKSPVRRPAA